MVRTTVDPKALRFPLTHYFVATGLITAVVVAAVMSVLSAGEAKAHRLSEHQEFAEMIAKNLNRQVHERFLVPTAGGPDGINLDDPEQLRALDEVVRGVMAEFQINTVFFFDLEGRIEYATSPELRGVIVEKNEEYERARAGQSSSILVQRGDPLDIGGEARDIPLLESYVPAHHFDAEGIPTSKVRGVIEIYQDASHLVADIEHAVFRAASLSSLGVVALMLALWLWIRKAERTIDERTSALLEANESLAALSEDLEQQVEDRSRRLLRAETLATVGTLGAGVAHEVNNPMAAIASCAEGLLRRTKASEALREHEDFADFPEYLEIIRSEAFRVKAITRNLLDFSRQGTRSKTERVDLRELLVATDQLFAHRLQSEQKALELDVPQAPVVVQGDGAGLRQLILNLTVNAVEAMPEGGTIRWSLAQENGSAILTCEDEGPGFTEDDKQRGLEPFYTRKPTGKGTGLGLSIAYGIVREHGGDLELTNKTPGPGARVLVRLATTKAEPKEEKT